MTKVIAMVAVLASSAAAHSSRRSSASIVIDSTGDTNEFDLFAPNTTSPISTTVFAVNPNALPTYAVLAAGAAPTVQPSPAQPARNAKGAKPARP